MTAWTSKQTLHIEEEFGKYLHGKVEVSCWFSQEPLRGSSVPLILQPGIYRGGSHALVSFPLTTSRRARSSHHQVSIKSGPGNPHGSVRRLGH